MTEYEVKWMMVNTAAGFTLPDNAQIIMINEHPEISGPYGEFIKLWYVVPKAINIHSVM